MYAGALRGCCVSNTHQVTNWRLKVGACRILNKLASGTYGNTFYIER